MGGDWAFRGWLSAPGFRSLAFSLSLSTSGSLCCYSPPPFSLSLCYWVPRAIATVDGSEMRWRWR